MGVSTMRLLPGLHFSPLLFFFFPAPQATVKPDEASWGEKCLNPCSGEKCNKVAKMMEHLVDFTVDPCDDFFAFSCSAKTRGTKGPFPRKEIAEKEVLLKFPPKKFEYIQKFYNSFYFHHHNSVHHNHHNHNHDYRHHHHSCSRLETHLQHSVRPFSRKALCVPLHLAGEDLQLLHQGRGRPGQALVLHNGRPGRQPYHRPGTIWILLSSM